MTARPEDVHVVIGFDVEPFIEALQRAAEVVAKLARTPLWAHLEHQLRHHYREDPAASAMHTAYDRRRRARRRRR